MSAEEIVVSWETNANNNIGFRAVLPANTEKGTLANAYSCSRFAGRKEMIFLGLVPKGNVPGGFSNAWDLGCNCVACWLHFVREINPENRSIRQVAG